jgi:hypothetical protein
MQVVVVAVATTRALAVAQVLAIQVLAALETVLLEPQERQTGAVVVVVEGQAQALLLPVVMAVLAL